MFIMTLLNFDKLQGLLSRLKKKHADHVQQMRELAQVEAEIAEEQAAGKVTLNFVTREFILGYRGNELPVFQKLQGLSDAIERCTIYTARALCGEYATLEEYCIVSHRTTCGQTPPPPSLP